MFHRVARRIHDLAGRVLLTGLALVLIPAIALAKQKEVATAAGSKESWTLAYLLTLAGIALGLVVVLRPGRRTRPGEE